MNRITILFFIAFFSVPAWNGAAAAEHMEAAAAMRPAIPCRIISLAPSITEILFSLGLGDRVVGVTRYCRFPPQARQKTQVGGYNDPNFEEIIG